MTGLVIGQAAIYLLMAWLWGAALWVLLLDQNPEPDPLTLPVTGVAALLLPFVVLLRGALHARIILGDFVGDPGTALSSYVAWMPQGQATLLMLPPALLAALTVFTLRGRVPSRVLAGASAALCLPILWAQAHQGHVQILGAGGGLVPTSAREAAGGGLNLLHLVAATSWVGCLLQLTSRATRASLSRSTLLGVSRLASLCVTVLLLSGLGTYALHFGAAWGPLTTGWGVVLLIKGLVYAAMLTLGWQNRRLIRQSGGAPKPAAIRLELALGVAALALASGLTQLDPHAWE